MTRLHVMIVGSLVLLVPVSAPLRAASPELRTLEWAAEAVHGLASIPLKGIPQSLLHDAAGVAVIPHVVKTALVVDHSFGRGLVLSHEPDGRWSYPVFVTLKGGGIGGEVGIEETDLVLVFKTRKSLERALRGQLTLGGDVAIAAGPLGRDTEMASNRPLQADIYSYSRSHGLFVGVALEGAKLHVDEGANEAFYGMRSGRASSVLALHGVPVPVPVVELQEALTRLSTPAAAPVLVVPAQGPPPVLPYFAPHHPW